MKIVASGDWHIGLVVQGYDANPDIEQAAREVIVACQDADLFVHLGDLFHSSRPRPRDYALAISLLSSIHCSCVVLKGNHDEAGGLEPDALEPLRQIGFWPGRGTPEDDSRFEGVKMFPMVPWPMETGSGTLLFVPYMNDAKARGSTDCGSAQEVVDQAFDGAGDAAAVFSHLDVDGATVGTEGRHLRGKWLGMPESAYRLSGLVVNGHLHQRQKYRGLVMPGSLLPTNMDEREDDKGYVVLEV